MVWTMDIVTNHYVVMKKYHVIGSLVYRIIFFHIQTSRDVEGGEIFADSNKQVL